MVFVFTITLLASSSLLFLVQPMFARMALPLLGGTPAVWNTCMVFFQACLLAGYLYAHLSTKWLGVRRQAAVHALVLLLPLAVLPITIGEHWQPPTQGNPVPWLLLLLTVTLGLPFFVVSSSAPLLQKWFSSLGHKSSDDPYFLYAASNAGSMTALLAYPIAIEPLMTLSQQSSLWTGGYVLLAGLTIACAALVLRHHKSLPASWSHGLPSVGFGGAHDVTFGRCLRWIALAAVPSSLLLGVTQYITTDLVVVPVLWVIPLALYLLTFILVFAKRRLISQKLTRRMLPPAAMALLIMLVVEATEPLTLVVLGHLAAFFVLALACHGELADDRPVTQHLTGYYLMLGIGGMLGGAFNALLAPVVFTTVAEYPIAIIAAAMLMLRFTAGERGLRLHDVALPLVLGACAAGLIVLANTLELEVSPLRLLLTAGIPAIGCYLLSKQPIRFGLALAAVFVASSFDTINRGNMLEAHRGFFGVHRITRVETFNRLYHGTTLHGAQTVDVETGTPIEPLEPLAYFHTNSPIGQVFAAWQSKQRLQNIGVVGLGVGALAAYANDDQRMTFYEIDPLVRQIAEDERYFTFLSAARQRGVDVQVVLGDARLTLNEVPRHSLDMLVIDAFSSDSIPVHLLTREAMELYLSTIDEGGVIAMHISNRYLNLAPVIANLASSLDVMCLVRDDSFVTLEHAQLTGREGSVWVLLAREDQDLSPLTLTAASALWLRTQGNAAERLWTDEYAHVLGALRW